MRVISTDLPEVLVLEPRVFADERGFFFESFNVRTFRELAGVDVGFVQDNHSRSSRNVLRGLHYQLRHPQGKLVRAVIGEIFDVVVDIRRSSCNFGQWVGIHISAQNKRQIWVPAGFAHGFLTLSDEAEVLYKTTDYWHANDERCIAWDDPELAIDWPVGDAPIQSAKDRAGVAWNVAEVFE